VQTGKFLRAGREEQVSLFNTLLEAAQEAQKNGDTEGFGTYMSALSPLGDDLGGPFANVVDNFLGISQQDDGAKPMAMGGLVPEAYAMGGLISDEPYGAMEMYADGGMITPQANVPPPAVMQQYQAYANGARQMGLTAIPFDKFAALQGSSQETIPSFSDGGMVDDDDASGKMVVDTDPNAPTDSIPAMIDGQRPAKLDSGEFVIPKDVVMFYGTDKLQKMIDKVRNPEGGKANGAGQPDTALGFGFGAAV
jgi:phage baseplate assembly protein gpV